MSKGTKRVPPARQIDHPIDVLRPFAWVFAVFFATGFWGYLALHPLG
jgi:hypothetical protein